MIPAQNLHITGGTIIEGQQDSCTATRNFLCERFSTSTTVKTAFESQSLIKKEQVKQLRSFAQANNLWLTDIPRGSKYLTRGGEALVYFGEDGRTVIKANDAFYYATWLEFLNSLVIHNLLFKETAYTLLGFTEKDNILFAVVQQPFIQADAQLNLQILKHSWPSMDLKTPGETIIITKNWINTGRHAR